MMPYRQVHLDFHTSEYVPGIGSEFNKKQFQDALKTGHVNSITVFAKCHHGWSYYPSKVNAIHPSLDFDLLKEELEACREIGVKAPVYLSAGFDERMASEHSDWLIRKSDETLCDTRDFTVPGYHRMCYNTPYLDKLLLEIEEVMEKYKPQGIFLDISAVTPCVCARCRKSIKSRGKDFRDEAAVMEQAEITYANYVDKVARTVHKYDPDCTIFHNGGHITRGRRDLARGNSHLELESLPTGGWGYDHFPMSAAYVMNLDMEYLGMTGKFHTTWGEFGGFKHPNALRYEAGLSLAFGAKCSIGDQLHPNGWMNEKTYRIIGEAYSEVEQKEPWCRSAENICDVAVLSQEAVSLGTATRDTVYDGDIGANRVLLEGKYLYTFIDLEVDFSRFQVLILPDTIRVDETLSKQLQAYLDQGGKLLLSGQSGLWKNTDSFAVEVGAAYEGEGRFRPNYCVFPDGKEAEVIYEQNFRISPTFGTVTGKSKDPYFNRDISHFSSHQHTPDDDSQMYPAVIRTGNTVYIGWNIFAEYGKIGSLQAKRLIAEALEYLLAGAHSARAALPDRGVLTLTRQKQENRYVAHLLFAHTTLRGHFNIYGEEKLVEAIEDIVPLHQVKGSIRVPGKVTKVYLAPQMEEISFTEEDGAVNWQVPQMECHQMVVFECEPKGMTYREEE
ncbi:MAG: alpha-L-fucosidase [Eubacteriales bacterium]|nr:alpha-L-fucosidase [Eubacteriales bacterium]